MDESIITKKIDFNGRYRADLHPYHAADRGMVDFTNAIGVVRTQIYDAKDSKTYYLVGIILGNDGATADLLELHNGDVATYFTRIGVPVLADIQSDPNLGVVIFPEPIRLTADLYGTMTTGMGAGETTTVTALVMVDPGVDE